MEQTKEFKKLEFDIERIPKLPSKLLLGDRLLATGQAEISEKKVTFYLDDPKSLAIFPDDKIALKVKEIPELLILRQTLELREASSDKLLFFELIAE